MTERRGRWIAVEGLDGCGKSTQVDALGARYGATIVREPGGTGLGRALRAVLLDDGGAIDARSEVLLFAADRAQLLVEVVEPALAAGVDVVSDRSVWSSVAYQGAGRALGEDRVIDVNRFALGGRFPDLVVLLDVDPVVAVGRLGADLDRIEQAPLAFFETVAVSFRRLAGQHGWLVVDGSQPAARVTEAIFAGVDDRLVGS